MLSSFYNRELWYSKTDEIKQLLNLNLNEQNLYLFPDAHTALVDTLWSMSRQNATKRKVFFLKSGSPYLPLVLETLAVLGFDLIGLSEIEFQKLDWINRVDSEVLAVIFPRDIPFEGRFFDWTELYKLLNEKKVIQVEIIHDGGYLRGVDGCKNPFHIQVYDFLGTATLTLFGRRANHESIISKGMNWSHWKLENLKLKIKSGKENQQIVLDFESKIKGDPKKIPGSQRRYYDRSVLSWKNLAATAVIELLIEKNLKYQTIQTPSLIYWGGLKTMDWLATSSVELEFLRGMLVIPLEHVKENSFFTILNESIDEVLKLQGDLGTLG